MRSQQPPDYILADPEFGTLRAITSDGTFLIVDDHNARIPNSPNQAASELATFFWRTFPDSSSRSYDFAIRGSRLRGGMVCGKLVLLGGNSGLIIWNGFPAGPADPPALTVAGSWNSDGAGLTMADGILYTFAGVGEGQDVRLSGSGLTGAALVAEDRVFHFSAFRLVHGHQAGRTY